MLYCKNCSFLIKPVIIEQSKCIYHNKYENIVYINNCKNCGDVKKVVKNCLRCFLKIKYLNKFKNIKSLIKIDLENCQELYPCEHDIYYLDHYNNTKKETWDSKSIVTYLKLNNLDIDKHFLPYLNKEDYSDIDE
jgi:hypothetical protein